jgi:hypothetical protein
MRQSIQRHFDELIASFHTAAADSSSDAADASAALLACLPLALVPELHHAQPERVPTLATGVHIRTQPERSNRRDTLQLDPAGDWRSTVDIRLAGLLLLLLLSGA